MECKCGNGLFRVVHVPSCDDCLENGAYDEFLEEYDEYMENLLEEK